MRQLIDFFLGRLHGRAFAVIDENLGIVLWKGLGQAFTSPLLDSRGVGFRSKVLKL